MWDGWWTTYIDGAHKDGSGITKQTRGLKRGTQGAREGTPKGAHKGGYNGSHKGRKVLQWSTKEDLQGESHKGRKVSQWDT